jgi:hypothetical protein
MLGEFTLAHIHLAAPANGPAAAYGINVHAKCAGRLKHRRANGEAAALA